jgi:hypothetical protein
LNEQTTNKTNKSASLDKKRAGALVSAHFAVGGSVESTLKTLLGAGHSISARSPEQRLAAVRDLTRALEHLREMPPEEALLTLDEARENVAEMEERARAATAEWEDAEAWVQMVGIYLHEDGAIDSSPPPVDDDAPSSPRRNSVSRAADTRDAIAAVMQRRPRHDWRPVEIRDAFVRAGRHATKAMIETTLRRMAAADEIDKTGRGRYRLWSPEEVSQGE